MCHCILLRKRDELFIEFETEVQNLGFTWISIKNCIWTKKGVWLKDVGRCVRYIWDISWHGCRLSFLLAVESRFNFISVWTHYLSHTDLPDFSLIDAWACSWVTIVLEKTDVISQSKCDKKVKLKKTALIDVSLPLRSGHLHCGKDNIEKVGPTKANEPPPWTIGSLKDKTNMYHHFKQRGEFRGQTNLN